MKQRAHLEVCTARRNLTQYVAVLYTCGRAKGGAVGSPIREYVDGQAMVGKTGKYLGGLWLEGTFSISGKTSGLKKRTGLAQGIPQAATAVYI